MRYFKWLQEHWGILAIFGSGFWAFVTALWIAFAVPVIDSHIDSRLMILANDSLSVMIDSHLTNKGGGFRGQLADTTKIPKSEIVNVLGSLILNEDGVITRLNKLEDELNYQQGFNFWVLKQTADKVTHNSVTFWLPPDGNAYYRDMYGYIWDAKFDNYDDCYYFYPSYANGNRLKCD